MSIQTGQSKKVNQSNCDFKGLQKAPNLEEMNKAPLREEEEQTKLSAKECKKMPENWLKPEKSIGESPSVKTGEYPKFNEKFRKDWEFLKEYVQFIAENKEIIGEKIPIWTHRFGGTPAEFWMVPTNKPVWGPRYLAEQIRKAKYHVVTMNEKQVVDHTEFGTFTGRIEVQETRRRLDARPVPKEHFSFGTLTSEF